MIAALGAAMLAGCLDSPFNPQGRETADSGLTDRLANVRIEARLDQAASPNTPAGAVRADALVSPRITARVSVWGVPGSADPPTVTEQIITADADGGFVARFSEVPARTAIAALSIEGGTIGGFSVYHGAADLSAGENTLVVVPRSSTGTLSLTTHLLETAMLDPVVRAAAPARAAEAARGVVADTVTDPAPSVRERHLANFANRYLPDRTLNLTVASGGASIVAADALGSAWETRMASIAERLASGEVGLSWVREIQPAIATTPAIAMLRIGPDGDWVLAGLAATDGAVLGLLRSAREPTVVSWAGSFGILFGVGPSGQNSSLAGVWDPAALSTTAIPTPTSAMPWVRSLGDDLAWLAGVPTRCTALQLIPPATGHTAPPMILATIDPGDPRVGRAVIGLDATSGATRFDPGGWNRGAITLTAPASGTVLIAGQATILTASVDPGLAEASRVQFLLNGTVLGESLAPPHQFVWTNPVEGRHTIGAAAVDAAGRRSYAPRPRPIVVTATQPYAIGEVRTIPVAAAGTQIPLPLVTGSEEYLAAIGTTNGNNVTFRLLGNGGGGQTLPGLRASIDQSELPAPTAQARASADMRRAGRRLPPPSKLLGAAGGASVRASESIGQTVNFYLYSRSTSGAGTDYTQRRATLRRIGTHCKLFVDPDPSNLGLSAISGQAAITEQELDYIQQQFDDVIYPLITEGYGSTFDRDGDGKVTILFSPLYNQLGFTGLFDPVHLYPRYDSSVGNSQYSNARDMFVIQISDPTGIHYRWSHSAWIDAATETLAHEFQHLASFVTRRIINAWTAEAEWLDEALSTGAETRYRLQIGRPAGEQRFERFASNPDGYSLTNFAWQLGNYGMVGIFAQYLFEQGGAATIRALVQNPSTGVTNVAGRFSARGGFEDLFTDWTVALMVEGNRPRVPLDALSTRHRHTVDLGIDLSPHTPTLAMTSPFNGTMKGHSARFLHLVSDAATRASAGARVTLTDPDHGGMRCSVLRIR